MMQRRTFLFALACAVPESLEQRLRKAEKQIEDATAAYNKQVAELNKIRTFTVSANGIPPEQIARFRQCADCTAKMSAGWERMIELGSEK